MTLLEWSGQALVGTQHVVFDGVQEKANDNTADAGQSTNLWAGLTTGGEGGSSNAFTFGASSSSGNPFGTPAKSDVFEAAATATPAPAPSASATEEAKPADNASPVVR
jgi:hypothetical protein